MCHSYTFNFKRFINSIVFLAIILIVVEIYLYFSLKPFEKTPEPSVTAESLSQSNFYRLSNRNPIDFIKELANTLDADPIVFVGDSQGAVVYGGGTSYPEQIAILLESTGDSIPVISLHGGGSNAFEQSVLLLYLLEAGINPKVVFWSNSIFSLRKNEIRFEYAAAYYEVQDEMDRLTSNVVVPALETEEESADPFTSFVTTLSASAEEFYRRSAIYRFMQRSLWDKAEILRRSPIGQLLPQSIVGRTARQYDPPTSILEETTQLVGDVSGILQSRGIQVVVFLSPINQSVSPRPFSTGSEAFTYPSLEAHVLDSGVLFLNLLNELPPESFGVYSDGSPDAFHISETGHNLVCDMISSIIMHEML